MSEVLITGSEGYIGSVLVEKLLKKGIKVTGLDTCFYTKSPKRKKNYTLLIRDVRDYRNIDLKSYYAIIHLAALSNDPMGEINQKLTEDINYRASVGLARKAKKDGVKRFLFSSSCSIYGISQGGIVDETSLVNPLTTYAKSKIDTEKELKKLSDNNFYVGLLRNSTVYGYSPRFRNDLVVNNLVTSALATGMIRVMSDGTPWRPLIDVRDLSDIFIAFLNSDKGNGEVINIGFNENNFQVNDLLNEIQKQLSDCKVEYTGEHGSDVRSYKVNFDKFKKTFPRIKQKWVLKRSINDLILQLKKNKFSEEDFISGKFARLSTLRSLLKNKLIDNKLYWIS